MDATAIQALLAILSTLVGGLIWVVRKLMARSEKQLERRDREVTALLKVATTAIEQNQRAISLFEKFEMEERAVHNAICRDLDEHGRALERLAMTQDAITKQLARIAEKLDGART